MIVNELAKSAGVTSNTVRHYTKIGLLEPTRDPSNGYNLFDPDDVHKLRFIQQAKDLGFTLNHIKEILGKVKQGESACGLVRGQIEQNIIDCEKQIETLEELRDRMESALQRWRDIPNASPNKNVWCHLIEGPEA